jgi:hypothetical protein
MLGLIQWTEGRTKGGREREGEGGREGGRASTGNRMAVKFGHNIAIGSDYDASCVSSLRQSIRQHTSAYVSIHEHESAYVSIREHESAYMSIREPTCAYVSIREYT